MDRIHRAGDQPLIQPDECVHCGACVATCPVVAMFAKKDVPTGQAAFSLKSPVFFGLWPGPRLPCAPPVDRTTSEALPGERF